MLIGGRRARCANVHAVLDETKNIFHRAEWLFSDVDDLYLVFVVFEDAQLLLVVEKIVDFAAVDLEERAKDVKLSLEFAVYLLEDVSGR